MHASLMGIAACMTFIAVISSRCMPHAHIIRSSLCCFSPMYLHSSFEDPKRALTEMQRVCRPNGSILLLEHGRSYYDWLNKILDKNEEKHTERWGCIWNRDIEAMVRDAGLEIRNVSRWHFGTTYVIEAGPSAAYLASVKEAAAKAAARSSWWGGWVKQK